VRREVGAIVAVEVTCCGTRRAPRGDATVIVEGDVGFLSRKKRDVDGWSNAEPV
jgi:hypothetical protein